VNKDGFTDFFVGRSGAASAVALSDGKGRFAIEEIAGLDGVTAAQIVDLDNDGRLDVVAATARGIVEVRNVGSSGPVGGRKPVWAVLIAVPYVGALLWIFSGRTSQPRDPRRRATDTHPRLGASFRGGTHQARPRIVDTPGGTRTGTAPSTWTVAPDDGAVMTGTVRDTHALFLTAGVLCGE